MNEVRGVVVADIGYTHSKLGLYDAQYNLIDHQQVESIHPADGPYLALDLEPFLTLIDQTLTELDQRYPVDCIVPSAHGSALALIDEKGELTLPVMDYAAQPPAEIIQSYMAIAPKFEEVFAPVLPGALTVGLQLFWQAQSHPEAFARTRTIMPLAQYAAWRLGGRMTSEITAFGAQTQLIDIRTGGFSSLARQQGWDQLIAPLAQAFEPIGRYSHKPLRGAGTILAGIHDSNANYLRYLATGREQFTLLSSGTWIIGFTPGIDLSTIDPRRDVVANIDYLGRPVASCRFMGGKEFEVAAAGADPGQADLTTASRLIEQGSMALPAFTDSGGPIPGCGLKGRFVGPACADAVERATLLSIYCALMSWQSLEAVGGQSDIIVDGPFARNKVYLHCLAASLTGRKVLTATSNQGTATGAAILGRCGPEGQLPKLPVGLTTITPLIHTGFAGYRQNWLSLAEGQPSRT